jgi:hypothetical protein
VTDALIAPDGPEWPNLAHLPATIAAWEGAVGRKLPAPYKAFLLKYNGGRIYPSLFDTRQPPDVWGVDDPATFVDPLYNWDYAISLWNQETYYDSTPPDMFFIGCNPGGLQILLSVRSKDHGKIYTWWGSNDPWGSAENTDAQLYPQADSFAAFIAQMYETPDGQAMAYWGTPQHKLLAQPLTVG